MVLPSSGIVRDTSERGFSAAGVSPSSCLSSMWLLHISCLAPGSGAGCRGLTGFQEQGHTAQEEVSEEQPCVLLRDTARGWSHGSDSRVTIPKKGKPEE